MTDIETARAGLAGHTLCVCRDGQCLYSDKRGIAPMMEWFAQGKDLRGCAAADRIVGRAAAFLFVRGGVAAVHAGVLSAGGKDVLEAHGIPVTYDTLTDRIINRRGDDICPMEKAVADARDPEEAYGRLAAALRAMAAGQGNG